MFERLLTYSRFVKIEHTLFSFPMLIAGALLAGEPVTLRTFGLILVAGAGARTAALGLNRILDRKIDRQNPRTSERELPSGKMGLAEAWLVTLAGAVAYLAAAWLISPKCLVWSPLPLAIFLVYPLLKRVTMWAHLGVGAALAMGPLGAWFAVNLSFSGYLPILLLCTFTFFWVAGFDIIYATLDEDFDRRAGLNSLPARLGRGGALAIARLMHGLAFGLLCALYWTSLSGPVAALILTAIGGVLYWEHRSVDDVELAFFKINAALGFVILGLVLAGSPGIVG